MEQDYNKDIVGVRITESMRDTQKK